MNNLLPVIASMSVGGIIGYSTNWIAIKMLFRPLREIRVFGIRVPFTPGVIPKQRSALGTSIGKTVENYLLTHDSVNQTINSADFQSAIKTLIENNLYRQTKSAKTLRQLFAKSNIDSDSISTSLHNITLNNRRAFVKVISKFCDLIVKKVGLITLKQLLEYNSDNFKANLMISFNDLLTSISHNFEENINNHLKLKDLLSKDSKISLEKYIEESLPTILDKLSSLLDNEEAKSYIYNIINKFLSESFLGSIVKNFIQEESLKNMIAKSLQKQLREESTIENIKAKLPKILESFYQIDISNLISEINRDNKSNLFPLIATDIVSFIVDMTKENSVLDFAEMLHIDINESIKSKAVNEFNTLVENKDLFIKKATPLIEKFLDLKVSTIANLLLSYVDSIITITLDMVVKLVDIYGEKILEAFDVRKMVEDQIDKLDLLQVEDIILSVMNNQLKAITWFGLLLGALLGLLMPYINSLLS